MTQGLTSRTDTKMALGHVPRGISIPRVDMQHPLKMFYEASRCLDLVGWLY